MDYESLSHSASMFLIFDRAALETIRDAREPDLDRDLLRRLWHGDAQKTIRRGKAVVSPVGQTGAG